MKNVNINDIIPDIISPDMTVVNETKDKKTVSASVSGTQHRSAIDPETGCFSNIVIEKENAVQTPAANKNIVYSQIKASKSK